MGYENSITGGGGRGAEALLSIWKGSSGHNAVMINQGIWSRKKWRSIGIGTNSAYTVMWFGEQADPDQ
jgi:hypothetical protein